MKHNNSVYQIKQKNLKIKEVRLEKVNPGFNLVSLKARHRLNKFQKTLSRKDYNDYIRKCKNMYSVSSLMNNKYSMSDLYINEKFSINSIKKTYKNIDDKLSTKRVKINISNSQPINIKNKSKSNNNKKRREENEYSFSDSDIEEFTSIFLKTENKTKNNDKENQYLLKNKNENENLLSNNKINKEKIKDNNNKASLIRIDKNYYSISSENHRNLFFNFVQRNDNYLSHIASPKTVSLLNNNNRILKKIKGYRGNNLFNKEERKLIFPKVIHSISYPLYNMTENKKVHSKTMKLINFSRNKYKHVFSSDVQNSFFFHDKEFLPISQKNINDIEITRSGAVMYKKSIFRNKSIKFFLPKSYNLPLIHNIKVLK